MIKKLITKIACLQKFFKREYILLVDNTFDDNAELCDNYALFEYLQTKSEYKDISFYIVNKRNKQYEEIKKKYPNNIIPTFQCVVNQKLINKLFKTKYWLDSFQVINRYSCNLKKYMQKSNIITVYAQHGITFMKIAYQEISKDIGDETFKKIVVSNPLEQRFLKKHYGYDDRNTILAGLSRWDYMQTIRPTDEKNIFIYFTFRVYLRNKELKLEMTNYAKNVIALCSSKRLNEILQLYNIKLKVAVHHEIINHMKNFRIPNIELVEDKDIGKIKQKASLFITDYSSMCFDFMYNNRPVIFYRLDYQDPILAINWEDRIDQKNSESRNEHFYNIFYDIESVINKVEEYCKNNFKLEDEYKEKNNKFFTYRENIRQHIIDGILASPKNIPNDCNREPFENIEFNHTYSFSEDFLPAISTENLLKPTVTGKLCQERRARFWFSLPEKSTAEIIIKLRSNLENKRAKQILNVYLNDKYKKTIELKNNDIANLKIAIEDNDLKNNIQKIMLKSKNIKYPELEFITFEIKNNGINTK